MAQVQITGGNFQDAEGNVLANGYLMMQLSQDAQTNPSGEVCSGIAVKVPLDTNGNVAGTVLIWPNDQLTPINTYYLVTGYNASGQPVWGPNTQQILSAPSPYNLNAWVPNSVTNWTPPPTSVTLQTNGVQNSTQSKLNLQQGSGVTVAESAGTITIASTVAAGIPTPPTLFGHIEPNLAGGYNSFNCPFVSGSAGSLNLFNAPNANNGVTRQAYLTAPAAGGDNITVANGQGWIWGGRPFTIYCGTGVFNQFTGTTNVIGISDLIIQSSTLNSGNWCVIHYDNLISSFWNIWVGSGVTQTRVSTGVTPTLGVCDDFKIVFDGVTTVTVFVNGTQTNTVTTNLFSPTSNMGTCIAQHGNGQGTGSTGMLFEYLTLLWTI